MQDYGCSCVVQDRFPASIVRASFTSIVSILLHRSAVAPNHITFTQFPWKSVQLLWSQVLGSHAVTTCDDFITRDAIGDRE
jgi:hypothetical protein